MFSLVVGNPYLVAEGRVLLEERAILRAARG
jgi:hypothetical protein